MRQFAIGCAALAAAALLQGCVAAVVPVVAGGAIIRGGNNEGKGEDAPTGEVVVAEAATQAADAASVSEDDMVEAMATDAAAESEAPIVMPATDDEESTGSPAGPVSMAEVLPAETAPTTAGDPARLASAAPTTRPEASIDLRPETAPNSYTEFLGYSLGEATREPRPDPFPSALLRNPATLDGERMACTDGTPTILIDLDPADGLFEPEAITGVDRNLAEGLQALRDEDIAIAWISGHSADGAGKVRRALSVSGLDLRGEDALLLMRYPDDRKQTRRRELAETRCILSIAGDTRADFDELYDYLKDPTAAASLEAMIGQGWFLTPLPLKQD